MNFFIRRFSALLACGFCVIAVGAQELRIGFVSTDRVLKEAGTAKAAQVKLEQEFSKREKDLAEMSAEIKSMAEKFEREAPTLPEAQRLARQKRLIEQDRDFQRKRREFQEDLNARKNEELQQVIQRANKVIKDLAIAEKFDFILQDAVYVDPKHDITDKVLKALNTASAVK